jgi:diketogulonate reductase-like aldo/keto reductase
VGTFQVKKEECYKVVLYALKVGYRCIDTAKVYKNEGVIGRAIKDSRINRTSVFITSKLSPADHGYQQAREAFFESLDDLGLDYLDLYLIHWPAAQGIPMTSEQNAVKRRESWRALESLYKEGKVRAIGVSNYTVQHLEQLREYAEITPHVNQIEFHPQCQQKELLAYCEKHNIKVVGYSPLGQGRVRAQFP